MKDLQIELQKNNRFTYWKQQLGFYLDENGVWRCGGRLTNADIPTDKWNQILLDKAHYITELIVTDTHHRVLHNGVADTLSELQSNLLAGPRKTVRSSTHTCMCLLSQTRNQGKPPPSLPAFWVQQLRPFQATVVDFAGPMYVRNLGSESQVWLCLYTCSSTRAVHLEFIVDMTIETFIRCLKRFTSRRGIPSWIVSDNGKTFTVAAKVIISILKSPIVKKYLYKLKIKWVCNLEKAPGGAGSSNRSYVQPNAVCERPLEKFLSHMMSYWPWWLR